MKQKYIVNKPIHGLKQNQTITIEVDEHGVPVDRQWRRRLKDAKIDNCLVKVTEKPTRKGE